MMLDYYTKCPCGEWRITPCGLGHGCKAFRVLLVPIDYDITLTPKKDRPVMYVGNIEEKQL